MIPAKLIKNLEKIGFELDFPSYDSKESLIIKIIELNNSRLNLAIPHIIKNGFDYKKIGKRLKPFQILNLDGIILITNMILIEENIDNSAIKKIIKENHIKAPVTKTAFAYFYDSFKETTRRKELEDNKEKASEIKARNKLTTNKALMNIFSPGKRKIMEKIYNHEPLTNTELKYYYRSIRPLNKAILNNNMTEYIRIIENSKKRVEK